MKLTLKHAKAVKKWLTEKPYHSWRRIAERAYEEWEDNEDKDLEYFNGNQMWGMQLCEDAAKVLGEDERDWYDKVEEELSDSDEDYA